MPCPAQPARRRRLPLAAVLLRISAGAGSWLAALPAAAAVGPWASAEVAPGTAVEARLVAAVDGAGELNALPGGLQVRLPYGWKTYWRSPGDAGLPPALDWTASSNLADATPRYPAPYRFTLFGIDTFGYEDEVVFPLTLRPSQPGEPIGLAASVDLLACSDVCVPAHFELALDLPAGPADADPSAANLIDRFEARVPGDGQAAGLTLRSVSSGPDTLTVEAASSGVFLSPDLFVEVDAAAGEGWAFGAPVIAYADDGRSITADLPLLHSPPDAPGLDGLPLTLTLVDGDRAASWTVSAGTESVGTTNVAVVPPTGATAPAAVPAGEPPAAPARLGDGAASGPALGMALALAVVGGLLLNLMPCVLPVLSLKLLSVVGQGGRSRGRVRLSFLASAAGVLASFLALACVLAALKASGAAIGWGIQFQQPLFLVFMVVLLTLFACNLLGLFEIILPSALLPAAATRGPARPEGGGLAGDFATGALAMLLATPCSAPFLGTAVGFALARGPLEIVAVFLALGLGLALPYLVIAAAPRLVARLPRPGRWMVTLRRLLGIALLVTAAWLLTVLGLLASRPAAALVAVLMAGIVAALWLRPRLMGPGRATAGLGVAALVLAAFGAPVGLAGAPAADSRAGAEPGAWVAWDRSAVADRVAAGQVVFVDVTADWCLTCKANETLVLDRGAAAAALAGAGTVAMRADWTRPDPAISDYLAENGRYGVPFYAVYGPAAPQGLTLPELLTENTVLEALAAAGGPAPAARPGTGVAAASDAAAGTTAPVN